MDYQSIGTFFENPQGFLEAWQTRHSKLAYSIKRRKAKLQKLNGQAHSWSILMTNQYANQTYSYITILNEIHRLVSEVDQSVQVLKSPEKGQAMAELSQTMDRFRSDRSSYSQQQCIKKYGPQIKELTEALGLSKLYQMCQALDLVDADYQAVLRACSLCESPIA
jgi:hypothetical protein